MFSVTFPTPRETAVLHTFLQKNLSDHFFFRLNKTTLSIEYNGIDPSDATKKDLIDTLKAFIIAKYEKKFVLDIIRDYFYFKDPDDQAEILHITRSIMKGRRPELPRVDALPSRDQILTEAFEDIVMEQTDFEFPSFEKFRLTPYKDCLLKYVELAIDEFKLQQEYLLFVEKLRTLVQNYRPIHHTIYVEDKQPFILYDDHYNVIHPEQNVRSLYPILKQWGITTEPSILVSLISLAPMEIFVYTDRQDSGVMRTLQRVFEERVTFRQINEMPTLTK